MECWSYTADQGNEIGNKNMEPGTDLMRRERKGIFEAKEGLWGDLPLPLENKGEIPPKKIGGGGQRGVRIGNPNPP